MVSVNVWNPLKSNAVMRTELFQMLQTKKKIKLNLIVSVMLKVIDT
jgi:hypothetical protein